MPAPYTHWFIRARLKTRQLLLLMALEEEGNIHRAAQVLNMTQPAASKHLKDLEDALGVPLFERLPRGVRPTWYGETMIRHARTALVSLSQAHDEIGAMRAGHFGQVAVGAITTPGMTLLPAAVALVKQAHPSLRITVQVETSDVLMERLKQGKLDMVVGRLFAGQDTTALRYQPLVEEPVVALARPGHPLLQRSNLGLRDLIGTGWIVPPAGSVLRHRFDLMFQQAGLEPPPNLIETTALLFITRMLEQSDLVAVLSAEVGAYYARHGLVAVLPVELPCRMDLFGLVTRSDQLLSPAGKAMMQALRETAQAAYGIELGPTD